MGEDLIFFKQMNGKYIIVICFSSIPVHPFVTIPIADAT